MINRFATIALVILALFLGSGWFRSCQQQDQTEAQITALTGKLTKTVDDLGRANFEKASFEGQYMDLVKLDLSKDSTMVRLQGLLKEKKNRDNVVAAVSFNASSNGRAVGVSRTDTLFYVPRNGPPDTAAIRSHVASRRFDPAEPPTFEGDVVARRDSTVVNPYKVRVGFDVYQRKEGRLIKTDIRPTDPNIEVTSAASFTKELDKPNRGFWAGLGAAITVLLLLFLPR